MKKSLVLVFVLLLSVGFISGCDLFGGDDNYVATTPAVTVSGSIAPTSTTVTAPGRNLALSSSDLTAELVDNAGTVLATSPVTSGSYSLSFVPTGVPVFVNVKKSGIAFMKRFLGKVAAPTAAATIANVKVDEASTAKALIVEKVLTSGSADAKAVLENAVVNPDVVTDFSTSDPATTVVNNVIAATTGLAATETALVTSVNSTVTAIDGGSTEISLPPVADTVVTAVDTAVTNFPKLSSVTVCGDSVYPTPTTVPTIYNTNPSVVVTFDKNVALTSSSKIVIKVTKTVGSTSTTKTVAYPNQTGYTTWKEAFGTDAPVVSNATISFTLSSTFSIDYDSTVTVEIQEFSGLVSSTSSSAVAITPSTLTGTFYVKQYTEDSHLQ